MGQQAESIWKGFFFFLLSKMSPVYQGKTLVQKYLQVPNPA